MEVDYLYSESKDTMEEEETDGCKSGRKGQDAWEEIQSPGELNSLAGSELRSQGGPQGGIDEHGNGK